MRTSRGRPLQSSSSALAVSNSFSICPAFAVGRYCEALRISAAGVGLFDVVWQRAVPVGGKRISRTMIRRAQMEKSSVRERSQEEKDRDLVVSGDERVNEEEKEEEEEEEELDEGNEEETVVFRADTDGEEVYGEVKCILSSRVVDRQTQYLIEWNDEHPDSWEPASNIARDVVSEYELPWWQAARKADDQKLKELLAYEGRDVNCIDENERTALFFAAGMGSEKCVRLLTELGAEVQWQDKDGFSPLHIAAGYVHTSVVKALLEFGADPELEDAKGRSSLQLAQDLLARTPRTNPMQFARRMALDQVVKLLDDAIYESVEVEQILDKRRDEKGVVEYLVKWSDDSEESWEPAENIGEDLVKDYEEGLEYGIAERVVDKREVNGTVEYLVQWADSERNTWEPVDNIAADVISEFEKLQEKKSQASVQATDNGSTTINSVSP